MRVLLTTDTIGGVWTYTKELTQGLLERSHAVALVSFGRLPSADQAAWCSALTLRFPQSFQYTASDVPLEWMQTNHQAYTGAERLLLDLAHSFGPDLLHTNQFCFGKLPLAIPKLVAAHSDVLSWAIACQPSALSPSPWLDTYSRLVQNGLRSADAVVAPTHWMLQALAQNFPLPDDQHVIPNGRDLPSSSSPERKLQAITAGRLWDPAKGLSTLAEVQAPFPLLVAGELEHEAGSVPPALGSAHLLGHLPEHHLHHLFNSSSIYLALSIYEPFGLAPLEAALCGCTLAARDIPSLHEVWGDAALFFDNPHTLTTLLHRLASDPALLHQHQCRALHRARQLSRAQLTDRYLQLYRHLLNPTGTNPEPALDPKRALDTTPAEVQSLAS